MNFRSVADLDRDILANLYKLPRDIDAVIGVPRSGMLAGSLIALALNLPLGDLEGFAAGRLLATGKTRKTKASGQQAGEIRHALIVDDSSRTGAAMQDARRALAALTGVRLTYCAIYGVPGLNEAVDLTLDDVAEPRIFEWNVMHHPLLASACVDIDGVLCHDPSDSENDDGHRYLKFLETARPLNAPSHRIGTLVTSRLERYRAPTEQWLAQHGITYDKLVMLDLPDAETRRRLGSHGEYKGQVYRSSDSPLFIESEHEQARQIAEISGKPVLCMAGPVMYLPGRLSPAAIAQSLKRGRWIKSAAKRVLGPARWNRLKRILRP